MHLQYHTGNQNLILTEGYMKNISLDNSVLDNFTAILEPYTSRE